MFSNVPSTLSVDGPSVDGLSVDGLSVVGSAVDRLSVVGSAVNGEIFITGFRVVVEPGAVVELGTIVVFKLENLKN